MKKYFAYVLSSVLLILTFLIVPVSIAAQADQAEVAEEDPGLTPDSFLWGLDRAVDQISLLLTLDSGKKANKRLDIARERLLEVKAMIEEDKVDAAAKAQRHHDRALVKVKEEVQKFEAGVSQDKIETVLRLESKIDSHEENAERIVNELNVKIKIEGQLTAEQQKLLDAFLESVKSHTSDLEIEIKEKKDRIKLRLREEGKTEDEIKIELERVAEERGIKHKEKAADAIREAEDELAKILEEKEIPAAALERFNSLISEANIAFEAGNFSEARRLAKRAEHLLEIDVEEREIEIEIEEGAAKVKVKVGEHRFRFALNTGNIDEIINEIKSRTGLSEEEIRQIMEVEREEKHEKGLEKAFKLRVEHIEREIEKSENILERKANEELKRHLEEAESKLEEAEESFKQGNVEEAKKLLVDALHLAVRVRGEGAAASIGAEVRSEVRSEVKNRLREQREKLREREKELKDEAERLKEERNEEEKENGDEGENNEDSKSGSEERSVGNGNGNGED